MGFRLMKIFLTLVDLYRSKVKVKPQKLWDRISQKRYEIERKCQQKLDRKSCMGFWMAGIFLTSNDLWNSKVKVKPQKLWSRISRERYEIERKCQQKLDKKSCMGFRMLKIFLTSGDLQRSKVKVKPQNFWSRISRKRYEIERMCQQN